MLHLFPKTHQSACGDLKKSIDGISHHANGMVESYCSIIAFYKNTLEETGNTHLAPLLIATTTFSKDLTSATKRFQQCLNDLTSMCQAMEPVLRESSDAAAPLMTNFFSSFSRQLCGFYSEVSAASSLNGQLFQKGALEMISRAYPNPTTASPANECPPLASEPSPSPESTHADPTNFSSLQELTERAEALTTVAVKEAKGKKRKKKETGKEDDVDTMLPELEEPAFISMSTTVENALSRRVLMKRPDVFSTLNKGLMNKAPELIYYIKFPPGKHLADYIVENYIGASNAYLNALTSELFHTSPVETEVGLFQCVDGVVLTPNKGHYSSLSSSGWRTISSIDHSSRLYSMYMFLEYPVHQRRALVHEVIICEGIQEELVHEVEALPGKLPLARVRVYSTAVHYSSSKSSTLARSTRGHNVEGNYTEVSEAEAQAATSNESVSFEDIQKRLRGATSPGAVEAFAPTSVQLASLGQPPEEGDMEGRGDKIPFSPFSMVDMAKGAMSVLTAPLTVGKAVMEITGVTDAMRSNMEATLRRSCPQLESQEILDLSSCSCTSTTHEKRLAHGCFFLLTHSVCFLPSSGSNAVVLEYEEIKEVKKCRSDRGEAIEVTAHIGEKFVFSNLSNRNNSYTVLMKQWLEA